MRKKSTEPESPVSSHAEERFTLTQALDAFYKPDGVDEPTANLERALLSVSFLLDYLSEGGNEPFDAVAALGLGGCLFKCAEHMALRRNRATSIEHDSGENTDAGLVAETTV
jgi:hypothetical protein